MTQVNGSHRYIIAIILATLVLGRPIFPRFFLFVSEFFILTAVHGLWLTIEFIALKLRRPKQGHTAFLLVCAGAIAFLIADLPRNYNTPKQSYRAAGIAISELSEDGTTYVIGITAELPFNQYLDLKLPRLSTAAEFRESQSVNERFYLAYSFERYILVASSELWDSLQAACKKRAVFPASVSGGEITIMECG